jgi:hypothetical protein
LQTDPWVALAAALAAGLLVPWGVAELVRRWRPARILF